MTDTSVWEPVEGALDEDLLAQVRGDNAMILPIALQIQTIRELKRLNDNVIDVENAVRQYS